MLREVVVDVIDAPRDVVWSVEEDLVGSIGPDGMLGIDVGECAERVARFSRKAVPDRHRVVTMAPHDCVRVILEDGTSVNRIADLLNDLPERVDNRLPLRGIKPDGFEVQERVGELVEILQLFARGLILLATEVNWSEFLELVIADLR